MFSKIKTMGKLTAITAVFVLSLSSLAQADSLLVDITRGALVVNNDGTDARLLLKFDLPQELTGMEVVFAELSFPLISVIPDSSALAVNCFPLLVSWDPGNVTWADLGDMPGAEVIGDKGTVYAVSEEGASESYFDVTETVRSWLDETIANNGLLFFSDPDRLPRFQYSRSEGSPFAQVKIIYNP